jgi:hypothetical protein
MKIVINDRGATGSFVPKRVAFLAFPAQIAPISEA